MSTTRESPTSSEFYPGCFLQFAVAVPFVVYFYIFHQYYLWNIISRHWLPNVVCFILSAADLKRYFLPWNSYNLHLPRLPWESTNLNPKVWRSFMLRFVTQVPQISKSQQNFQYSNPQLYSFICGEEFTF